MALKAKPKNTKKAPAKGKAAKAPAKATKPKTPENLIEVDQFAKFTGYRNEVPADEAFFEAGETVYIVEHAEEEEGILYNAIKASDVEEYLENGLDSIEGAQIAPSECNALKGGNLEKAKEAYLPITLVGRMGELLEENNGDAIDTAIHLNQTIQENYFYLGGALAEILKHGSHLTENGGDYEGEDAFNDFTQAEFGFKASKGRQLARIYTTFSNLPDFDPQELAGIGWSIAGKLEKYVTADNVDEVLETAKEEGVTQRTVDSIMQEKFVDASGKTPSGKASTRGEKLVIKTMNFRLSEDSAETVELALQQCMKQNGIESMELALERIALEWAQEFAATDTAKRKIKTKANKAEKARSAAATTKAKAPAKAPAKSGGRKKAA